MSIFIFLCVSCRERKEQQTPQSRKMHNITVSWKYTAFVRYLCTMHYHFFIGKTAVAIWEIFPLNYAAVHVLLTCVYYFK